MSDNNEQPIKLPILESNQIPKPKPKRERKKKWIRIEKTETPPEQFYGRKRTTSSCLF